MDNQELHEKWPELSNKIMLEHPEFTREELLLEIGKESDLLLRIQKKLGKTEKEIHDWMSLLG